MKKIIFLLLVLFCISTFGQMKVGDSVTVQIKEYAGLKIYGSYKLNREKEGKKEYECFVWFQNETDKDIFYRNNSLPFAQVHLNGLSSYIFHLQVKKANKKVGNKKAYIISPKIKYKASTTYLKWYNAGEVPEFVFKAEPKVILENDYSRYN